MRTRPSSRSSTVLLLTGTATSGQQAAPPPFLPNGALPVLDAYLEALRLQLGIPGMSAAVVHDGRIAWEKGYGFQNVAARIRATPDTPYMVGDMSGTLAAVLLLQCVEQRRSISIEPIREHGVLTSEPDVTTRQLLSHTFGEGPQSRSSTVRSVTAQLTRVMEWCVAAAVPKDRRAPARQPAGDAGLGARRRLAQDPALEFPEGSGTRRKSLRYRRNVSSGWPSRTRWRAARGSRRPCCRRPGFPRRRAGLDGPRSLALDAALDDPTLLLLDETREHAWTPTVGRRGTPVPMGLGWFVQTHRNDRVVWHFGQVPNAYSSLIIKLPAKKTTFILLANSDGLSAAYQLQNGDVTRSLFATIFLRLFT
jgi:CubicO group peptidase (beta-lactamase class C family)